MDATDIAALRESNAQARSFKRFGVQFTILIHSAHQGDTDVELRKTPKVTAYVTNISLNGMCFTSSVAFSPGAILLVDVTIAIHHYNIPVVVNRCSAIELPGRTAYACGAQFTKSAATSEFIPVLAKYLIVRGGQRAS
jgi:hypothetical protein